MLGAAFTASVPAPPTLTVLAVQSVRVVFMAVPVVVSTALLLVLNVGLQTGAVVGGFGGSTGEAVEGLLKRV